jgi:hypothetical protein
MKDQIIASPATNLYHPPHDARLLCDPPGAAPLIAAPPAPHCDLCVCIPVRNEAASLGAALAALAHQVDFANRPLSRQRYEVIVLANNCTDTTAHVARQAARRYPDLALHVVEVALAPHHAHVGQARRMAMDEAYRRLAPRHPRSLIASTDGDTRVAPTWLAATRHEIERGAAAVGGLIDIRPADHAHLQPAARRAYASDCLYRSLCAAYIHALDPQPHDPWPHHYHHTGASFALTTAAYARVGGLPPLPSREDVALYDALVRHDIPVRHSPLVRVSTSARVVGRASGGMAQTLDLWSHAASEQYVTAPAAIAAHARQRRHLRHIWRRAEQGQASRLPLATNLRALLADNPPFGLFYEQARQHTPLPETALPPVPISAAIRELRTRLRHG